jgi:hypothetical protein
MDIIKIPTECWRRPSERPAGLEFDRFILIKGYLPFNACFCMVNAAKDIHALQTTESGDWLFLKNIVCFYIDFAF